MINLVINKSKNKNYLALNKITMAWNYPGINLLKLLYMYIIIMNNKIKQKNSQI